MIQSTQLKWTFVFLLLLISTPFSRSLEGLNDDPYFIQPSKPEFCHIGCTTMTAMCYQALYYYLGTSISASTAIIVFCNVGGDWCKNGCTHLALRDADSVPDPIAAIASLASEPAAGVAATLLNPKATPLQKLQAFLAKMAMKGLNPGGAAATAGAGAAAEALSPITMEQKVQALLQSLGIQGASIMPGSSIGILTSLMDPLRIQQFFDTILSNENAKLAAVGLPEIPAQTIPFFRRDVEGQEGRDVMQEASESMSQIAGGLAKLIGLGTGSLSNAFHDLTITLTGNTTTAALNSAGSENPTTTANAREAPAKEEATDSKFRQSLHNLLSESANTKKKQ